MERLAARPPEVSGSKEQPDHRLNMLGSLIFSSLLLGAVSSWLLVRDLASPGSIAVLAPIVFLTAILIMVKFELLVLVAFSLLFFVKVEPAPADILFAALIIGLLIKERDRLGDIWSLTLVNVMVLVFMATNFTAIGSLALPHVAARYILISLYLLALFYFIRLYVTDVRALKIVLVGYVIAASAAVMLGLLGLFDIGISATEVLAGGRRYPGYFRLQGLFKDPNVFGPFIIPAMLLLLEDLRRPWLLKVSRPVKIGILILLTLGVILAFSRAGFLNIAVALVLYLFLLARSERLGSFAVAVGVGVLLLVTLVLILDPVLGFLGLDFDIATNQVFSLHHYDAGRFETQRLGLEAAAENPFGVGPAQYGLRYKRAAHSLYLRVLVEQGWLGFIALVALIGAVLAYLYRIARAGAHANQRSLAIVLLASISAILANSFFVDTLHWRHFWLLLGLGWALKEISVFGYERVKD